MRDRMPRKTARSETAWHCHTAADGPKGCSSSEMPRKRLKWSCARSGQAGRDRSASPVNPPCHSCCPVPRNAAGPAIVRIYRSAMATTLGRSDPVHKFETANCDPGHTRLFTLYLHGCIHGGGPGICARTREEESFVSVAGRMSGTGAGVRDARFRRRLDDWGMTLRIRGRRCGRCAEGMRAAPGARTRRVRRTGHRRPGSHPCRDTRHRISGMC